MEIRTTITKKTICRKCKTVFLSKDNSKCPECSRRNLELATKREENKKKRAAKSENDVLKETEEATEG